MSWMKRTQGGAPPPAAVQPPYGAPQPYGNQQNMYSNQGTPSSTQQSQQQQYWQMQQQQPQSQYNQQFGQMYQQQGYTNNANQYYQQPTHYNQNYANQNYNNTQQQYPQNYYANQGVPQQNYAQSKVNNDGWEDNWDWGWEDSSKQKPVANQIAQQASNAQSQVCNNANVIEESFVPSNTWNWAMEDKKEQSATLPVTQETKESPPQPPINTTPDISSQNETNVLNISNPSAQCSSEEVNTLNDRDVVKEKLPNLGLGKRFHLENLTPQWSIESQMSQESSDGPHTHSEGTYRSETQSRNSSKSSPGLNTDNSNFNYSQSRIDEMYPLSTEWSKESNEDSTIIDSHKSSSSRRESHDEISSSMQEMSISNAENFPDVTKAVNEFDQKVPENLPPPIQPPPSSSPADFVQPLSSNLPPPSVASSMPPPPPVSTATQPSSTMSSASVPPPTNFPPPSTSQNPFKHAGPFSHKNISKTHSNVPSQPFPPQMVNTNLTSPAVVGKISQHNRIPVGYGANLETTPDNSERPDQPQTANFMPMPLSQQIPDNLEVAPQNDRNEYLQTEHLSSVDYGENTDFSGNVPPPGLRRMVVGQQETEYSQNLNISGDEPPPGLARMVPGQQTESDGYNQSNDNYMDRHVDGQMTDNTVRPFRQADGQQTPDNYTQPPSNRAADRRPIGLDRMVPGESSNNEYMQYQGINYGSSSEPRVVTGVDHVYPLHGDAGPPDVREQNVDGSDYTEATTRNPTRNVIGLRESNNDLSVVDFGAAPEEQQREVTMEGENLQDLSIISGVEMTFSREQMFEVVSGNITEMGKDRSRDVSDSVEYPTTGSRRQSVNRVNTSGEDSERDRTFKSSPRRDRDKHKSSRDRDRDRERDKDGRYSRGDRKHDRDPDRRLGKDGRRSEKDRRDRDRDKDLDRRDKDRDISPNSRRHRRSTRSRRYETEDTDYYSDRERDRRRYREGSYTSKPPRPDDKERRHDDRRRYNTTEREGRYDEEGNGRRRSDRQKDRYERRYRDIDPTRKYGNLRREEEERRRGETYSSPSRAGSREATATDEDAPESERRRRDRRPRAEREPDPYYLSGYGSSYGDPFMLQRQQYSYYERLRRTDPAAYMRLYKQLLAAPHKMYAEGYSSLGYDIRTEDRGSVHSGRSSANGLKGNDTYYGCRLDAGSLRDAPSLRTDLSDRDLNTDASLNLHLEESTVRSERMTPFKFSTAHIKASMSARHVVVVQPSYPVDGRPATVQLVPLASATYNAELLAYPGPLVKGVTHKKSVIDYCTSRISNASKANCSRDTLGYVLVWELLALLLRQNGVVVGTDIAELLMKNTRDYEYKSSNKVTPRVESRHDSLLSGEGPDEECVSSPEQPSASTELTPFEEESSSQSTPIDEKAALDRLREYLIYGNRQEALEWAMNNNLWGHALQLAAYSERRIRAGVAARFLASVPRTDPLHTLYSTLAARLPPAATCVAEERWGDWRPHAAIILSNSGARPDHDRRALTQLGDSLASRGLPYSAQFCYLSGGVQFTCHPLAPLQPPGSPVSSGPPRLGLLLADPRAATLRQLATDQAIFATEIYEYALSLTQEDYVIEELQVYKLIAACRLVDAGQCERALSYAEQAARAVTRSPRRYAPALAARLAELADRLKYYDPALQEDPPLVDEITDGDSGEPSPRHHQQWLDDVKNVANMLEAEALQHSTPQHQPAYHDQTLQYQQPAQTYTEAEATPDYTTQYYQSQLAQQTQYAQQDPNYAQHDPHYVQQDVKYNQHDQSQQPEVQPVKQQSSKEGETTTYPYGEEWQRTEEQAQSYADPYWQNDSPYGYGEAVTGTADNDGLESRPIITMPGTASTKPSPYSDYDDDRPGNTDAYQTDRDPDIAKGKNQEHKGRDDQSKVDGKGKSGWFGGILTKLSLRQPNQMILPDDKNPTIVWDAEHKRWRNLESDGDEVVRPPPPPPSVPLAHAAPPASTAQGGPGGAVPGAPPVSNIFKMQKGRHIKKSYVDVFNPSGATTRPLPPAAEVLGAPPPAASPTNYFVPTHAQAPQGGFYDPTSMSAEDDQYRSGI